MESHLFADHRFPVVAHHFAHLECSSVWSNLVGLFEIFIVVAFVYDHCMSLQLLISSHHSTLRFCLMAFWCHMLRYGVRGVQKMKILKRYMKYMLLLLPKCTISENGFCMGGRSSKCFSNGNKEICKQINVALNKIVLLNVILRLLWQFSWPYF